MNETGFMDKKKSEDNISVSREDVINFLNETDLKGYQSIDLPFGFKTPGMDRSKSADIVFKHSVKGKSVLDIGCKYGYFCHDAIIRGASVVNGIEISDTNVEIAKKIVGDLDYIGVMGVEFFLKGKSRKEILSSIKYVTRVIPSNFFLDEKYFVEKIF